MSTNPLQHSQAFVDTFYKEFENYQKKAFPFFSQYNTQFSPHFISPLICEISQEAFQTCQKAIVAFHKLRSNENYLHWATEGYGAHGLPINKESRSLFSAFDFHLSPDGPRLIEINTNAGFGLGLFHANEFRRSLFGDKYKDCFHNTQVTSLYQEDFKAIFQGTPHHLAIVDSKPLEQALHFEFVLFQKLLDELGYKASICDVSELSFRDGELFLGSHSLQGVYNRLTDFYLREASAQALNSALKASKVSLSPHPFDFY